MAEYLWLIPTLPFIGFLINGLGGLLYKRITKKTFNRYFVSLVACGLVFISLILSTMAFVQLANMPENHKYIEQKCFNWVAAGDITTTGYYDRIPSETKQFNVEWTYFFDPLSAVMALVVCGVGFLIHVFAIGYMWDDTGFYRFFSYLNLFMFAMLTLVLSNNFIMMFLGWEGVGFCSYALIGYYFHKKSASDAGKKAFIVNRVGDYGFSVGMFLLFVTFGTFNFKELGEIIGKLPVEAHFGILSAIGILLFIGATGKSAQIPLYVWLPDAMEGPTPVSALIHAATMVTAGVYMITRSSFLYTRTHLSLEIVGFFGVMTALYAAIMGFFQRDIKKVLAYSTISQLGYMFTALGVAAFSAGIMHLMTHAFFKALLFLGAGSIITQMHHEQDMQKMGNLRKYMPITFWTMAAAYLAICGIPPFSGFFSKDEILWQAFARGHKFFYVIGLIAAIFTAFYMTRLMILTFFGKERIDPNVKEHLKESPAVMTIPLIILGILATVGGFVGLPAWLGENRFEKWLEPVFEHNYNNPVFAMHHYSHGFEMMMAGVSILAALLGFSVALYLYGKKGIVPDDEKNWGKLWKVIYNKFYVDELYDALFVNRAKDLGNALSAFDLAVIDGGVNGTAATTRGTATASSWFDKYVVDGLVNLQAWIVQTSSGILRRIQTGVIHNYALAVILGIVILSCLYIFR